MKCHSLGPCMLYFLLLGCSGDTATIETSPGPAAEDHPVKVTIAPARRGRIRSTLELTGNLLPRRRTIIVSEIDGVIEGLPGPRRSMDATPEQVELLRSLGVDLDSESLGLGIGDEVKQGSVLVQLRKRDFELALQSVRARLKKAEAELAHLREWKRPEEIRRLEASQARARAELEEARRELGRAESLREKDALTLKEYDRRATEVKTREAALGQATASLEMARSGPTASELAVAQALVEEERAAVVIAEENVEKTTVRSPYDCVVTDLYVDVGDRVTALPRVEIMEIMDLSLVVAQVGVPERFIDSVAMGDRVTVRAKRAQAGVPGLVVRINDKVDPETRTYRTRAAVDNRDGRFKAGQFARIELEVSSSEETLTVPTSALTYSGGRAQVFVYRDGRVQPRSVTTGIVADREAEILSGLSEGERVATDELSILSPGMAVRPVGAPEEDGS